MFSTTGLGLQYNSEVECVPHTGDLEHGRPSRIIRAPELDQGLAPLLWKGLGGGYVRLWGSGHSQSPLHILLDTLEFELVLELESISEDGVLTVMGWYLLLAGVY